jgi:hypothetical protein
LSAFQRLKDLLLDDERAGLSRAEERIEALERGRITGADLPRLIDDAARGESAPRLARALAAPVADALGDAVQQRRQSIVDALFPVIGPAIRRAIAEALRGMVADLNAAIESSLTPRGLRWRLEAWRTGVPYAQVVLRHTLRWRIDHLFLIEPDSGLVIHRESAPGLPDLDSDAIAGMLTAIGEFVRDSVGREGGATLGSADVGEHLLWVEEGPRARLACFIRGAPPPALRVLLRERLERIHERFADPMAQLQGGAADVGAALAEALDLGALAQAARALDDAPPARPRWPAWLAGLLVLAVLAAWGVHEWRWSQRLAAAHVLLRDWPGLAVQRIAREDGGLRVRALLDPLADPPREALAALLPAGAPVHLDLRGYVSADPPIVARRAQRVLAPPEGVTLACDDGTLRLAGELPRAARAELLARAALVPGVLAVDGTQLVEREVRLRAEFDALRTSLESRRIAFDGDAEAPRDPAAADALVDDLRRLLALAREQGLAVDLRTWGGADGSGSAARNAALRAARASWLARELSVALGVEVFATLDGGAEAPATLARVAAVRVELQGGEPR